MTEMTENETMMPLWEAQERAQRGASELEEVINRFNDEPDKRDRARHADLTSHFMSLLAGTYGIAAPTEVTVE